MSSLFPRLLDTLSCPVCFELYSSDGENVPYLLSCGHTCCLCLHRSPVSASQRTTIVCPHCTITTITGTDKASLNSALKRNYALIDVIRVVQQQTRQQQTTLHPPQLPQPHSQEQKQPSLQPQQHPQTHHPIVEGTKSTVAATPQQTYNPSSQSTMSNPSLMQPLSKSVDETKQSSASILCQRCLIDPRQFTYGCTLLFQFNPNPAVVYCSVCCEDLCVDCDRKCHMQLDEKMTEYGDRCDDGGIIHHRISLNHTHDHLRNCVSHPNEPLEIMCITCQVIMCRKCHTSHHKPLHNTKQVTLLHDGEVIDALVTKQTTHSQQHREAIQARLQAIEETVRDIQQDAQNIMQCITQEQLKEQARREEEEKRLEHAPVFLARLTRLRGGRHYLVQQQQELVQRHITSIQSNQTALERQLSYARISLEYHLSRVSLPPLDPQTSPAPNMLIAQALSVIADIPKVGYEYHPMTWDTQTFQPGWIVWKKPILTNTVQ